MSNEKSIRRTKRKQPSQRNSATTALIAHDHVANRNLPEIKKFINSYIQKVIVYK